MSLWQRLYSFKNHKCIKDELSLYMAYSKIMVAGDQKYREICINSSLNSHSLYVTLYKNNSFC